MSKVKELIEIASELHRAIEESDDFSIVAASDAHVISPEVFGAWVSTIFINQNNAKSSAPRQEAETKTVEGRLESKGKKNVNGKDLFHVKIDGQFYNTFNRDAFGGLKFNVGDKVKAKVKNNKGYWNLIELELVESNEEPEDIDF